MVVGNPTTKVDKFEQITTCACARNKQECVGNPTTKVDKFEQITTDNADGWQRTRW